MPTQNNKWEEQVDIISVDFPSTIPSAKYGLSWNIKKEWKEKERTLKTMFKRVLRQALSSQLEEVEKEIPYIVRPIPKKFPIEHTQGRNYAYNEVHKIFEKLKKP